MVVATETYLMHAVRLTVSFTIHSVPITKWTKTTKDADFRGFRPWALGSAHLDRASRWQELLVEEILPFMVIRKYIKGENTGEDQDEIHRSEEMPPLNTQ